MAAERRSGEGRGVGKKAAGRGPPPPRTAVSGHAPSLGTLAPRPASSGKHRPLFVKQHLEGGTRRYPLREASKLGPALRVRRDVDVAKMHETRDDRDIRDRKALTD